MLILSKFHDYYDTAMGSGIDKTCVYQRATDDSLWMKGWNQPTVLTLPGIWDGSTRWDWKVHALRVGFCGKWYPMLMARGYGRSTLSQSVDKFLYTAEETEAWFREWGVNDRRVYVFRWHKIRVLDAASRAEFFRVVEDDETFRQFRAPILLQHLVPPFSRSEKERNHILVNPCLREWEFQRVKDPFTAFQEIHMYLSGVLGTSGNDMAKISDKDQLHKKGFDERSFKKAPSKRGKPTTK